MKDYKIDVPSISFCLEGKQTVESVQTLDDEVSRSLIGADLLTPLILTRDGEKKKFVCETTVFVIHEKDLSA